MNIVPVLITAQAAQQRQPQAERALLDAFRLADATAPDRAQSRTRLGIDRTPTFTRLEGAGVVQSDGRDRYYLNEAAVVAQRSSARRRPSLPVFLVIAVLVLVGLLSVGALVNSR